MLYFHNAILCTPSHTLSHGSLLIDRGRIITLGETNNLTAPRDVEVFDCSGLVLAPGFIDLQLNGGFGLDFTQNPEAIWSVAAQLPRYGVTAFLPTIITSPPETIQRALQVLRQGPPPGFRGATPLGLHLEGPFLNPGKKGAHNPAYIRPPSLEAIHGWTPENGVRLVTLAPELPGALEVIQELVQRGVTVSAGHSLATYEQAMTAFAAGVTCGTHLFNAMPPLGHREPGLAAALLTHPAAATWLIADGIHVHPAMVALAWASKGSGGLALVTDGMAALGMPAGDYALGDFNVHVDSTSARLADGTLAGSIITTDASLRYLMQFTGCSLPEALTTLTNTPARLAHIANKGELRSGMNADLVLLTPQGEVKATVVAGEMVYSNRD